MARRAKRKNKHDKSSFVLSHILRSKQTNEPLTGEVKKQRRASAEPCYRRLYRHTSGAAYGIKGVVNRRIYADELEDAVVPAIFGVFSDRDWIMRRRITPSGSAGVAR